MFCDRCTFANPPNAFACHACGFVFPSAQNGVPIAAASAAVKWSCYRCSYDNPNDFVQCEMCEASRVPSHHGRNHTSPGRPLATPTLNGQLDIWVCTMCTLENALVYSRCQACQTIRPEVLDCIPVSSSPAARSVPLTNGFLTDAHVRDTPNRPFGGRHPFDFPPPNSADDPVIIAEQPGPSTSHMLSPQRSSIGQKSKSARDLTISIPPPRTSSLSKVGTKYSSLNGSTTSPHASTSGQLSAQFMEDLRLIDEAESFEAYQRIVRYCQNANESFIDDSFRPERASLGSAAQTHHTYQVHYWLRPQRIRPREGPNNNEWAVVRPSVDGCSHGPTASDIVQGALGNCWFLSALAVLTERPELIEKVLVSTKISSQGVYRIRLCVDGQWRMVIIDDRFPCDKYYCLVYSEARRKQLWVPLIEKALAKLRGSYGALISGRSLEGLATLTGAPCEAIPLQHSESQNANTSFDPDLNWARLLTSKEAGFLMGASCGLTSREMSDEEKYDFKKRGLEPNHAYSVLDVREVNGYRLIRLRNPWGRFSWNGDWSDRSSLWTHDLYRQLMPEGSSEGIFWMNYYDFTRYFDNVDICKIRTGWHETRLCSLLNAHVTPKHFHLYELTVTETTEVDFTLYQCQSRSEQGTVHGILDLCIIVCQKDEMASTGGASGSNHLSHYTISSMRVLKPFCGCSTVLHPGVYYVATTAFNHWGLDLAGPDIPNSVLAVHSAKPVSLKRFVASSNMLADMLIKYIITQGEQQQARQNLGLFYVSGGGLMVLIENWSEDACALVEIDCSDSENVVSTRGTLHTYDSIPPMSRQIIAVLTQLESSSRYYISHRLSHRLHYGSGLMDLTPPGCPATANHFPPITDKLFGLHGVRPIL